MLLTFSSIQVTSHQASQTFHDKVSATKKISLFTVNFLPSHKSIFSNSLERVATMNFTTSQMVSKTSLLMRSFLLLRSIPRNQWPLYRPQLLQNQPHQRPRMPHPQQPSRSWQPRWLSNQQASTQQKQRCRELVWGASWSICFSISLPLSQGVVARSLPAYCRDDYSNR